MQRDPIDLPVAALGMLAQSLCSKKAKGLWCAPAPVCLFYHNTTINLAYPGTT
jgi:hypothetical protein